MIGRGGPGASVDLPRSWIHFHAQTGEKILAPLEKPEKSVILCSTTSRTGCTNFTDRQTGVRIARKHLELVLR